MESSNRLILIWISSVIILMNTKVDGISSNSLINIYGEIENESLQTGVLAETTVPDRNQTICYNGGFLDKSTNSCKCMEGTSGHSCESVDECIQNPNQCDGFGGTKCAFDVRTGKSVCKCEKEDMSYDALSRECKMCLCGSKGTCHFEEGNKTCECEYGYKEVFEFCQECNCGMNGRCDFVQVSKFMRKECFCLYGSVEHGGLCKECFCGVDGNCTFNNRGKKLCKCEYGYGPRAGICQPCGCEPGEGCRLEKEEKRCICQEGYHDVDGVCEDVKECLHTDACPPNSFCINTLGSYDCNCKQGFEEPYKANFNPYQDDCVDIDECVTLQIPCFFENTVCVNTFGNYRCDCKQGYYRLTPINPDKSQKYNKCFYRDSPSSVNVTGIVVGCLCGGIIFGILMFLYKESCKSIQDLYRIKN